MSNQILAAQDLSLESSAPLVQAGTILNDYMGRTWAYVQASEALSQGDALTPTSYAAIDADVDATAAAGTRRVTGTGDFTAAVLVDMAGPLVKDGSGNILQTPDGHVYWLWVNAGASQGQGGPIVQRVSDNAVDVYFVNSSDGAIATGLTTSSDYVVLTTTRADKADAAAGTDTVGGFVQRQGGVTDEYWSWVLIKGWGVGSIDTSDTAITAGEQLVTGTDDGTVQGVTTGTAADLAHMIGVGTMDQDADGLVPIYANCAEIFRSLPKAPASLSTAFPGSEI